MTTGAGAGVNPVASLILNFGEAGPGGAPRSRNDAVGLLQPQISCCLKTGALLDLAPKVASKLAPTFTACIVLAQPGASKRSSTARRRARSGWLRAAKSRWCASYSARPSAVSMRIGP